MRAMAQKLHSAARNQEMTSSQRSRIASRFRVALAGKGLLLFSLALVFGALLQRGALAGDRHVLLRAVAAVLFGVPFFFLVWTSLLAFADAVAGQAVRVDGAVALGKKGRFSGVSFRLPDGRSAEFILAGPPIEAGRKYAVTIGRWSRVLVEPPVLMP